NDQDRSELSSIEFAQTVTRPDVLESLGESAVVDFDVQGSWSKQIRPISGCHEQGVSPRDDHLLGESAAVSSYRSDEFKRSHSWSPPATFTEFPASKRSS